MCQYKSAFDGNKRNGWRDNLCHQGKFRYIRKNWVNIPIGQSDRQPQEKITTHEKN